MSETPPVTQRPRVSHIIPVHNGARYIGEALRSLEPELRADDEVIVVDDGSTDGSGDLAAAWHGPVTVLRQACAGVAAARNRGLAASRGEWFAFLDADDLAEPNRLAHLGAFLLSGAADLVHGGQRRFVSPECVPPGTVAPEVDEPSALIPGTLLAHRRVYERVGGFNPELRVGELLDWVGRIRAAGLRIVDAPGVVMRRRRHENNVSARPEYRLQALNAIRESLKARRQGPAPTSS